MAYRSTKTFPPLSCCFRQWRAESHCRFLHGYGLIVHVEFEANELDGHGWVIDFGSLKTFKDELEAAFDHKTVVAEDDPYLPVFKNMNAIGMAQVEILPHVGCEAFAQVVREMLDGWLEGHGHAPRVLVAKVEVREHANNSAMVLA